MRFRSLKRREEEDHEAVNSTQKHTRIKGTTKGQETMVQDVKDGADATHRSCKKRANDGKMQCAITEKQQRRDKG